MVKTAVTNKIFWAKASGTELHCKIFIGNYRYGIGILQTASKSFSLYRELLKPLWVICHLQDLPVV